MSDFPTPQPKLSDLLARFLNKQAQAQAAGLAPSSGGEVMPYDAGPVQPIDARLAWDEAVAALSFFHAGDDATKWPPPPHWSNLVAAHEPAVAVAFCVGNYPQLVRSFQLIAQKSKPGDTPVAAPVAVPALFDWAQQASAKKKMPDMLIAVGALRLANQSERAEAYMRANDAAIAPAWRAAWANEKAALAWHQGQHDAALAQWNALEDAVPVLFNRGMAEVFVGDRARGRAALDTVIGQLPATSAWHHLARVYALLA